MKTLQRGHFNGHICGLKLDRLIGLMIFALFGYSMIILSMKLTGFAIPIEIKSIAMKQLRQEDYVAISVDNHPLMELAINGHIGTGNEQVVAFERNKSIEMKNEQINGIIDGINKSHKQHLQQQNMSITSGEIPAWLMNSSPVRIKIPPLRTTYAKAFADFNTTSSVTMDPSTSFYRIINPKPIYSLCDVLEIQIMALDKNKMYKTTGGDYLFAKIHSNDILASANPEDGVIDHNNGSYTARFKLRWTGRISISVFLIYSSEVISALRRVRDYYPARGAFDGIFWKDGIKKVSPCHVTPLFYVKSLENTSYIAEFCNYTDPLTGAPWFCAKPASFTCSSYRYTAASTNMRDKDTFETLFSPLEKNLLRKSTKMQEVNSRRVSSIHVKSESSITISRCMKNTLLDKSVTDHIGTTGFYFKDTWISLNRPTLVPSQRNITQCLKDKTVNLLGDSTIRQWFKFLIQTIEPKYAISKQILQTARFSMDHWDNRHNISINYHHHAFPIVTMYTSTNDLHYVANMIDSLPADGVHTVYFLSVGAHFTITDMKFFRGRLRAIKRSIVRLHERSPDTMVVVRSANTRKDEGQYNNWYHDQLNSLLFEEFVGLNNVVVIDVWSMTLSHYSGWNIHPVNVVVRNELAVALSYICPDLVLTEHV
ncbi:NXPE family member 3-like [Amphiura filiformis]|uniref:NXPE family member 3-like n=1 Tax=Amphiura filiformis TaxID=82378 RepID=UPI003B218F56